MRVRIIFDRKKIQENLTRTYSDGIKWHTNLLVSPPLGALCKLAVICMQASDIFQMFNTEWGRKILTAGLKLPIVKL